MTMYGAPLSSSPDVDDARDVLALDLDRRAGLAEKARYGLVAERAPREQELQSNLLVELDVVSSNHHAHASGAKHALHAVLAPEDVARLNSGVGAIGARHYAQPLVPRATALWPS